MNDILFDKAFINVKLLSTIFRANENRYLSPAYQEAEIRKDFIDKFFADLGWDVNHDEQTDPYAQEVKVERGVETRTVDYAFFLKPNYGIPIFWLRPRNRQETLKRRWKQNKQIRAIKNDLRTKPGVNLNFQQSPFQQHAVDFFKNF